MQNKYRIILKIKRIFESCKTYDQWNTAVNWFENQLRKNLTLDDYVEIKEMIDEIFFKIELKHTGAIINPPSNPDNDLICVGGYPW